MAGVNRVYPWTVPANGSISPGVVGEMFKVLAVSAPGLVISGSANKGSGSFDDIPLIAGRELRADFQFSQIHIENTTAAEITVELFIGSAEFEDDSIVGTVAISGMVGVNYVPDPEKSIFSGYMGLSAPGGNYIYCAIENPLGSGKTFAVRNAWINAKTAGTVRLMKVAAHVPGFSPYQDGEMDILNISGGEDSVAITKVGYSASHPAYLNEYFTQGILVDERIHTPWKDPFLVNEGEIFYWRHDSPGITAYPGFEWEEF